MEVVISQPVSEKIADWDTYTGQVDDRGSVAIRAQVRGQIKEVLVQEGEATKVIKLMDALQQSVAQSKTQKAAKKPPAASVKSAPAEKKKKIA